MVPLKCCAPVLASVVFQTEKASTSTLRAPVIVAPLSTARFRSFVASKGARIATVPLLKPPADPPLTSILAPEPSVIVPASSAETFW